VEIRHQVVGRKPQYSKAPTFVITTKRSNELSSSMSAGNFEYGGY
jgi:hypothetical protein